MLAAFPPRCHHTKVPLGDAAARPSDTPNRALPVTRQGVDAMATAPAIVLVRQKGFEPLRLAAHAPKACASAIPPLAHVCHR